jgi:PAS domain S-box-containing protein
MDMTETADRSYSPRCAVGALVIFGLLGGVLLAVGPKDYPNLHSILDTGMALLSSMLALLLWEMGSRISHPLPKWLAISFAATSLLEIIHVLVTVEWSGPLAAIAQEAHFLRPATWPPATHVLPVGVGYALWLSHRGKAGVLGYAAIVCGAGAGLFAAFQWLPTYTPPGPLGITRPALILAPLMWLTVGIASWRLRRSDRILRPLVWVTATLFLANAVMLYSQAPADAPAMVAHLGKICGYMVLLLSLMQMASQDMADRIRAERELAKLNENLERRVGERTQQLEVSEHRYRNVVELIQEAIWIHIDGTIVFANPAATKLFGAEANEALLGLSIFSLLHPDDREGSIERTRIVAAEGRAVPVREVRLLGLDGRTRIAATHAVPFAQDGRQAVMASGRDVTAERAAEAQLQQAQKMEQAAIGDLRAANEELARRSEEIRRLSTPVLQLREGILIAPIIGVIDPERARQLIDGLLRAVRAHRAQAVVIDVTGVAEMDTNAAAHLVRTAEAIRLMGAHAIVTGLSAQVAAALVELGIDLGAFDTVGDLRDGLEGAERSLGYCVVRSTMPATGRAPRDLAQMGVDARMRS